MKFSHLQIFISKKYLFSAKSNNTINIITGISIVGITVGTAAMILILSVFNGLTGFIETLFDAFDSDIRIEASIGNRLQEDSILIAKIRNNPEIKSISRTIEGKAGLKYFDRQAQAIIKGVDTVFKQINPIDSVAYLYEGHYDIHTPSEIPLAILGSQVAANLNANIKDEQIPIQVFVKTNAPIVMGDPMPSFKNEAIFPAGFFSIQKEYDDLYVLVDIAFARDLFDMPDEVTAYEIALKNPRKAAAVKTELIKSLGKDFKVLTINDRHASLHKVMRNEKYISYFILLLLLIIVSVNIVGSLSMIVLEKKRDIAILKTLGMTTQHIRNIFLLVGIWVGSIGLTIGLFIGLTVAILQKKFELVPIAGSENFRIKAFPIELQVGDFLLVIVTVMSLAIFASLYPSQKASSVQVIEGINE